MTSGSEDFAGCDLACRLDVAARPASARFAAARSLLRFASRCRATALVTTRRRRSNSFDGTGPPPR